MLRISRLTDYAFILLNRLDGSEEDIVSCSDLAEETPLPLPTVRKVAKKLSQEGLLVSHQGAHGGYELARGPAEVSVAEVISAMEGPIGITLCSDEGEVCEIEEACPTSRSWKVINAAIRSALDGLTLADMQRPIEPNTLLTAASPGTSTDAAPSLGATSPDDQARRSNPR